MKIIPQAPKEGNTQSDKIEYDLDQARASMRQAATDEAFIEAFDLVLSLYARWFKRYREVLR